MSDIRKVEAEVTVLIPEFKQAWCKDSNGWSYSLAEHAEGNAKWDKVVVGEKLDLDVLFLNSATKILKANYVNKS